MTKNGSSFVRAAVHRGAGTTAAPQQQEPTAVCRRPWTQLLLPHIKTSNFKTKESKHFLSAPLQATKVQSLFVRVRLINTS